MAVFSREFSREVVIDAGFCPGLAKIFWVAGYILVWLEPATNHSGCDYPRGHGVVGLGPRFGLGTVHCWSCSVFFVGLAEDVV